MSTCASRVALALLALGALHAPVASSDEFTPEKYGIGAVLVRADSTSPIVIRRCLTGGPADQAGLLPGDHLLQVDGVSVESWSFTKVLDYLIREAPLPLRITVLRGSAQRSFEIVRARFSDIAAGEGFRYVPSEDSLGYMIIPLEESAPLPVGSILKSVGLRNPRCHDVELPPYAKGHTLLYFWSSWCGPCKVLISQLPALREQVAGTRLRLVGINVDRNCELFQAAVDSLQPPGEQYWAGGWFGDLPQALRVHRRGIPSGALIDQEGHLVKVSTGVDSVLALLNVAVSSAKE